MVESSAQAQTAAVLREAASLEEAKLHSPNAPLYILRYLDVLEEGLHHADDVRSYL